MSEWKEDLHPRNKHGEFGSGSWISKVGNPSISGLEAAKLAPNDGALKLSPEQIAAIKWYTGPGFSKTNSALRGGKGDSIEAVPKLDSIFAKAPPLKQAIVVERSVRKPVDVFGPVGSRVGETFTDNAFVSVTHMDRHEIGKKYGFGSNYKPGDSAAIAITVPAGAKGFRPWKFGKYKDKEGEILLDRGYKFKITHDSIDAHGIRQMQMEIVG